MGSESSKIKSLQIVKINPGSVSHKNNLLPFMHTIVSYNGNKIKENADIAKLAFEWEEKDLDLLLLDLRTEKEFSITIPKKDNLPLGMSVKYHEGLLRLYCIYVNKINNESLLIEKDYIIGIEGVSCDSESNLLNYIELKGREGLILLVFNDKLNYIRRVNFKVEKEKVFEGTEVVKGILYSTKHEKKIKMEEDEEKIKRDIEGIVKGGKDKGKDGGSKEDREVPEGSKGVPEDKGQDMGDTKGDIKEPTTLTTTLKNNSIVKENQINKEDLKQLEKDLENQQKPRDVDEIAENLENYKEEIEKPREEEKSSLEKELEEIKKKINEEEEKEIREQREREKGKEVKEKGEKDKQADMDLEGKGEKELLDEKDLGKKEAPEDKDKTPEDQGKDLGKEEDLDKEESLKEKDLGKDLDKEKGFKEEPPEENEPPLKGKDLDKEKGYEEGKEPVEDKDLSKEPFEHKEPLEENDLSKESLYEKTLEEKGVFKDLGKESLDEKDLDKEHPPLEGKKFEDIDKEKDLEKEKDLIKEHLPLDSTDLDKEKDLSKEEFFEDKEKRFEDEGLSRDLDKETGLEGKDITKEKDLDKEKDLIKEESFEDKEETYKEGEGSKREDLEEKGLSKEDLEGQDAFEGIDAPKEKDLSKEKEFEDKGLFREEPYEEEKEGKDLGKEEREGKEKGLGKDDLEEKDLSKEKEFKDKGLSREEPYEEEREGKEKIFDKEKGLGREALTDKDAFEEGGLGKEALVSKESSLNKKDLYKEEPIDKDLHKEPLDKDFSKEEHLDKDHPLTDKDLFFDKDHPLTDDDLSQIPFLTRDLYKEETLDEDEEAEIEKSLEEIVRQIEEEDREKKEELSKGWTYKGEGGIPLEEWGYGEGKEEGGFDREGEEGKGYDREAYGSICEGVYEEGGLDKEYRSTSEREGQEDVKEKPISDMHLEKDLKSKEERIKDYDSNLSRDFDKEIKEDREDHVLSPTKDHVLLPSKDHDDFYLESSDLFDSYESFSDFNEEELSDLYKSEEGEIKEEESSSNGSSSSREEEESREKDKKSFTQLIKELNTEIESKRMNKREGEEGKGEVKGEESNEKFDKDHLKEGHQDKEDKEKQVLKEEGREDHKVIGDQVKQDKSDLSKQKFDEGQSKEETVIQYKSKDSKEPILPKPDYDKSKFVTNLTPSTPTFTPTPSPTPKPLTPTTRTLPPTRTPHLFKSFTSLDDNSILFHLRDNFDPTEPVNQEPIQPPDSLKNVFIKDIKDNESSSYSNPEVSWESTSFTSLKPVDYDGYLPRTSIVEEEKIIKESESGIERVESIIVNKKGNGEKREEEGKEVDDKREENKEVDEDVGTPLDLVSDDDLDSKPDSTVFY